MTEKISNSDLSTMDEQHKRNLEHVELGSSSPPEYNEAPEFDERRTKTLLRKLDWHLVPFLSLLYL